MPKTIKSKPTVTIIGGGEIGQAIGYLLGKTDLHAEIWDRDPNRASCRRPLEEIVPGVDYLFLCVPSWALQPVGQTVQKLVSPGTVIVTPSKGISEKNGKFVDDILTEVFPRNKLVLLAGPMLAEEIMQDLGAAAVVASSSNKSRDGVISLFSGSGLRTETSADVHGIAVASVLKNIYALALGITDGLSWGGNRKGWLTCATAKEINLLLKKFGADPKTYYSAAGLADMICTGFSRYSRNHQVGDELVKTHKLTLRSEGTVALPSIVKKVGKNLEKFQLLNAISDMVEKGRDPHVILERYFNESN